MGNKCSGCRSVAMVFGSAQCAAPRCHKDLPRSNASTPTYTVSETIQEKTRRIIHTLSGASVRTRLGLQSVANFEYVCKLVAIAQAEALEEAAKLHSFGEGIVDKGDLLNTARDLRESVK